MAALPCPVPGHSIFAHCDCRAPRHSLRLARFPRRAAKEKIMRELHIHELAHVAGARSKNVGGGPGNSGPGDKNSKNERGHGGLPPSWAK
jgi:hypothetical protein